MVKIRSYYEKKKKKKKKKILPIWIGAVGFCPTIHGVQSTLDAYVLHYFEKYNNWVLLMKINLYVKMTGVFTI